MLKEKHNKFYYGWIVALSCSLLAFSVNAMGNNSLTFYVTPLAGDFGTSRTLLNFCLFTMTSLLRTGCGFVYGWLSKHIGTKRLMWIGVALAVSAYVIFSRATGVALIAVGAAFYGIAHAVGTFSAYNLIINNWFVEKKGLVLGFVNVSVGLGGMVINPLASHWIANKGWSSSFLYTAIIIAAIAIPALAVVKISPQEMGLEAYGAGKASKTATALPADKLLSLKGAMGTLRFWLIAAMQFMLGFVISQGLSNLVPHFNSVGVDAELMSKVVSVVMAAGIAVGALSSGFIYDRFGLRVMYLSIGGIQFCGLVSAACVSATTPAALAILAAFCVGYGNSMVLGTLAHLINAVFGQGRTQFGAIFSWLFAANNAGSILGSPFAGTLFDLTGSYQVSYIIGAVSLVVFLVAANLLISMGHRHNNNAEKA